MEHFLAPILLSTLQTITSFSISSVPHSHPMKQEEFLIPLTKKWGWERLQNVAEDRLPDLNPGLSMHRVQSLGFPWPLSAQRDALCWVQDPIIKTGGAPPPRVPSERVKHIKEPRWEAAKRLKLKMSCCPSWELLFWAALVSPLRPGTRRDFLPLTSRNERIYSRIGGPDLNPHSVGLNRRASPGQRNQKWVQAWQQSGFRWGCWPRSWLLILCLKNCEPKFPRKPDRAVLLWPLGWTDHSRSGLLGTTSDNLTDIFVLGIVTSYGQHWPWCLLLFQIPTAGPIVHGDRGLL